MSFCRERFCFLALQKFLYLYPKLAHKLYELEGSATSIFRGNRNRFRVFFGDRKVCWQKFVSFNAWRSLEDEVRLMDRSKVEFITFMDDAYPALLKEIYDPPLALMCKGKGLRLLNSAALAIVGSRKATRPGLEVTLKIAEEVSLKGFCVVSGLAFGIDSAAHKGALIGSGNTIAVLGTGLDLIYPSSNLKLADEICEVGLLVSEFPFGSRPEKFHFPQRNRIISGLSIGTLVVEASEKSGSLITASFALEQGRDVYAVPGQGAAIFYRGSNSLIRDGACLVEDGRELSSCLEMELIKYPFLKKSGHFEQSAAKGRTLLDNLPKRGSQDVDSLVEMTGVSAEIVLAELTKLTLEGMIEELPGRRFRKKQGA